MSVNSKLKHCGVDFGTTNSSLAISQNFTPIIVPIDRANTNQSVLKSLIYIDPQFNTAVGSQAISKYLYDLEHLPSCPPRYEATGRMIKTFGPSSASGVGKVIFVPEIIEVDTSGRGRLLQSLKSVLTSQTFGGTTIFNKFFPLEDLLSLLLTQIKTNAETELNYSLDSIVIGRPVRYVGTGESQLALSRMTQIAKAAGFKNIEFEYEPIGAALNYGINISQNQNILVFDFGGGTLDVCIMKLPEKEVLSVSGRPIGGDLLNSKIVESKLAAHFGSETIINGKVSFPRYFLTRLTSWYQTTLLKTVKDVETLQDLAIKSDHPKLVQNFVNLIVNDYGFEFFRTVDQSKIDLSSLQQTIFNFDRPQLNINQPITRSEFESAIAYEIYDSRQCIYDALELASLKPNNIDKVILTGGSSQIPIYIYMIQEIFPANKIITSDHFTAVAAGLSLRAEQIFS